MRESRVPDAVARPWIGAVAVAIALLLPGAAFAQTSLPTSGVPRQTHEKVHRQAQQKTTRIGLAYGNTLSHMSEAELADALDDAVALHAHWIRADLSWTDAEPLPGVHRWSSFDRIVAAAAQRHLKVLPILTYSPAWARAADCVRFTCPPARPRDFVSFAKAAVRRYGPRGVRSWEIWNEPNLGLFWAAPDATTYGTMLGKTGRAIHRLDPGATVLLGGLAAIDPSWFPGTGSVDPRDFLAGVCATGACGHIDGVAYHPYTYPRLASDPHGIWDTIGSTTYSLRSVLKASGHPGLMIWATEFGAPTGGTGSASDGSPGSWTSDTDHVTEGRQAQIARDGIQTAERARNVAALFWYTDEDDPLASGKEAYFGLRRSDGSAKPAWYSFRNAAAAAAGS